MASLWSFMRFLYEVQKINSQMSSLSLSFSVSFISRTSLRTSMKFGVHENLLTEFYFGLYWPYDWRGVYTDPSVFWKRPIMQYIGTYHNQPKSALILLYDDSMHFYISH